MVRNQPHPTSVLTAHFHAGFGESSKIESRTSLPKQRADFQLPAASLSWAYFAHQYGAAHFVCLSARCCAFFPFLKSPTAGEESQAPPAFSTDQSVELGLNHRPSCATSIPSRHAPNGLCLRPRPFRPSPTTSQCPPRCHQT